jgi:hypothetical protein
MASAHTSLRLQGAAHCRRFKGVDHPKGDSVVTPAVEMTVADSISRIH